MVKWERERRLDLSFREKITLSADAPIRTAGGLTRTRDLESFQTKFKKNPSLVRMDPTRTADGPLPALRMDPYPHCGWTPSALTT